MNRAYSVDNVYNAKFNGLAFDGKWLDAFGKPERRHSWFIYGRTTSGKTTFNMQLAKYLSSFGRVIYDSLEEGLSASMQEAYNRVGMTRGNKVILIEESIDDLIIRLKKPKSPNIAIIDSVRYTRLNWIRYKEFCAMFPNKLFIWIAHARGKEPKGALAEDIMYDSFVKIYTEGYRAFISSRFSSGGESTIDIWPEGAAQYWAELNN
jgi:hypothetical protein